VAICDQSVHRRVSPQRDPRSSAAGVLSMLFSRLGLPSVVRLIAPDSHAQPDKKQSRVPSNPALAIMGSKDTKEITILSAWSGHTALNWMGARGGRGVQAQELEAAVKRVYEHQGRFTCPPIRPGSVMGSALCDPSRCECVDYAGKTADWPRSPIEWQQFPTCRVDPDLGFGYLSKAKVRVLAQGARGNLMGDELRGQCWSQTVGIGVTEGVIDCQFGDVVECRDESHGGCAVVSFLSVLYLELDDNGGRSVPLLRQMNDLWYHALDPDSFKLTEDVDGFGVYWCWDKKCRNYYRYGRSRLRSVLVKPADYVRACPGLGPNYQV